MRLQKGVAIVGIEPTLARDIVRSCHDWSRSLDQLLYRFDLPPATLVSYLEALTSNGYLEVETIRDEAYWKTTLRGGGLANASFLRPISRRRADELIGALIERAIAYNQDPDKPMYIDQLLVFGSYLSECETLGDVDIALKHSKREWFQDANAPWVYARQSDRSFRNVVERLCWGENELLLILRSRNPYLSIHTEDITRFTDKSRPIYTRQVE